MNCEQGGGFKTLKSVEKTDRFCCSLPGIQDSLKLFLILVVYYGITKDTEKF